eukprot:scaffold116754_cov45-Tisochrysis_lutea.AAC.1
MGTERLARTTSGASVARRLLHPLKWHEPGLHRLRLSGLGGRLPLALDLSLLGSLPPLHEHALPAAHVVLVVGVHRTRFPPPERERERGKGGRKAAQ